MKFCLFVWFRTLIGSEDRTQVDWSISADHAGASETGGDHVSWEEGGVMTYFASKL